MTYTITLIAIGIVAGWQANNQVNGVAKKS